MKRTHAVETTAARISLYFAERNRLESTFAAMLVPSVLAIAAAALGERARIDILGPVIAFCLAYLALTFYDLSTVERRLVDARAVEGILLADRDGGHEADLAGAALVRFNAMEGKVERTLYLPAGKKVLAAIICAAATFGTISIWEACQ